MALIACRECSKEISSEAPACPNCGVPQPGSGTRLSADISQGETLATAPPPTAPPTPEERAAGKKRRRVLRTAVIIWGVAAVLVFSMSTILQWMKSPERRAEEQRQAAAEAGRNEERRRYEEFQSLAKYSAATFCETEGVRQRLKAPSTARFVTEEQRISTTQALGIVRIVGAVDAQNGFGAMIRNRYACEVTRSGSSWTLNKAALVP